MARDVIKPAENRAAMTSSTRTCAYRGEVFSFSGIRGDIGASQYAEAIALSDAI